MQQQRSPSRGRLRLDDGELLFSALQSCLNTLSDWECVGVDSSDTNGVDSSSLSPPVAGELCTPTPISRSLSLDSFSRLEVGTCIVTAAATSSFDVEVEVERVFFADADDAALSGMLLPMYLSSVDLERKAGLGDGGGETKSEDGLVLRLLPVLFRGLCEQADLVLRWDATLRWELVRCRNTVDSCELLSSELPGSSFTGIQW